jgi:hypothetical protein
MSIQIRSSKVSCDALPRNNQMPADTVPASQSFVRMTDGDSALQGGVGRPTLFATLNGFVLLRLQISMQVWRF